MIQIQHVSKLFERNGVKNQALNDLSLTVDDGDIFGVIGYSGAGKSTLIRMVNALERPTSGKVVVDGRDVSSLNYRKLRSFKKQIGMVFQHFNLLESKTVFGNVSIPLVLESKSKEEIKERVTELLEFVGLSDKAGSYPDELSGGQKQRVGIARALALNPSILLCDEATSALDPKTTDQILDLLKNINTKYKITILLITHEMTVIQKICNHVAVMEKGKIIERGSVFDVFGHPKQKTTRDFVRSVIRDNVPASIHQTLESAHDARTFKIEFIGDSATKPLIDALIKQFRITVNIVFANMSEIQGKTIGHMVISVKGAPAEINAAVSFLQQQGTAVKEVN
ncbi:methionine ABC transporter ATP-binding protein [Sporolactobacillus terrae]|uniref:methionine ABC transporter ATP-binding protein n=1 Tax=Sporolactobacillus terrae TaxID=269673 RepID=UPI00048FDDAC|nr:ATP-binding cassette domain-containing protein [Sporolactobacillus terrae]